MRIAAGISTVFCLAACDRPADPPARPATVVSIPAASAVGSHSTSGRTVTVALPFRSADLMEWAPATEPSAAFPFVLEDAAVRAGAEAGDADLALFTYRAAEPGSARLEFGLVPRGRKLVGPADEVFTGSVARWYVAEVAVD